MAGDDRPTGDPRGWFLPVIVVAAGIGLLVWMHRHGALSPIALSGAGWAGLALMLAGLGAVIVGKLRDRAAHAAAVQLAGVLACGIGALLVIYA